VLSQKRKLKIFVLVNLTFLALFALPGAISQGSAASQSESSLYRGYGILQGRLSSSRPGFVNGLHSSVPEIAGNFITLSWMASLKSENVDRYAVYLTNLTDKVEQQGGSLVGFSRIPHANFSIVRDGYLGKSGDGIFHVISGDSYAIWVVAHNAHGWGKNAANTANPDTYFSKRPNISANGKPPYPKFVVVLFR